MKLPFMEKKKNQVEARMIGIVPAIQGPGEFIALRREFTGALIGDA